MTGFSELSTPVSTIIASALTAFVASCLRKLWLARIDLLFSPSTDPRFLQGKWATALAVSPIADLFRHFDIQLTYLIGALITTSIVASLTPTSATRELGFSVDVAPGPPWRCAMVRGVSDKRYSVYEWRLPNGSYLAAGGNWAACPSRWAVTLMGGINFINASQYAYADLGVAIKSTAIGTPVSVYGKDPVTEMGAGLSDFLGRYGSNAVNTTQCARVMTANPVACRRGGKVLVDSDGTITATSTDGQCSAKSIRAVSDSQTDGLMAKSICSRGAPGQATIVLGGINAFARWLAVAVNDPGRPFEDEDARGYRYAITCDLDARDVFRYRSVTLSLQDSAQIQETNMGRQLNGGSVDCKKFDAAINLGLFATAVSANWQPLSQNDGLDGWFDSVNQMTIDKSGRQARPPPYAFSNSQNALEDTLGLVVALATARINGTSEKVPARGAVINTRVGSGKLPGLAYAVPPLLTALTLLALLLSAWPSKRLHFACTRLDHLVECSWLRQGGVRGAAI
ncbi:hypothetical protein RB595_005052 [Gaeumannomyces hyphopodioides]